VVVRHEGEGVPTIPARRDKKRDPEKCGGQVECPPFGSSVPFGGGIVCAYAVGAAPTLAAGAAWFKTSISSWRMIDFTFTRST